jgi:pyridoxine 5-phosphate synthase
MRALEGSPMTKLSVNVNKVATLRNTRTIGIPSVVRAAAICLDAGADGITIHPRPDRRHIRPADVHDLAMLLKRYPGAEFNIEGNPFHEYMYFAQDVRPAQCTLVPDETAAVTSDHGWDLRRDGQRLRPIVTTIQSLGCRVSLFIDSDPIAVELAAALGAQRVELYTAPYAEAFDRNDAEAGVAPYVSAATRARELGIAVNAGHDLSLKNLAFFLGRVPDVAEVSIGHALIADALEYGLADTVRQYLAITGSSAG